MSSAAELLVVVPLRLASMRVPRKVLADVSGRTLAERTMGRVIEAFAEHPRVRVFAAVDHEETLISLSKAFPGLSVLLTDPELPSGTDRVFAAVMRYCDSHPGAAKALKGVINVQGDMPYVGLEGLRRLAGYVLEAWSPKGGELMATLSETWPEERDYSDPAAVKVITDRSGRAIYFSRHPIPYSKFAFGEDAEFPETAGDMHLGVYAYTLQALARFCSHAPVAIERAESLEQLRAQWLGIPIQVLRIEAAVGESFRGVDTPADMAWARSFAKGGKVAPTKKTASKAKKKTAAKRGKKSGKPAKRVTKRIAKRTKKRR